MKNKIHIHIILCGLLNSSLIMLGMDQDQQVVQSLEIQHNQNSTDQNPSHSSIPKIQTPRHLLNDFTVTVHEVEEKIHKIENKAHDLVNHASKKLSNPLIIPNNNPQTNPITAHLGDNDKQHTTRQSRSTTISPRTNPHSSTPEINDSRTPTSEHHHHHLNFGQAVDKIIHGAHDINKAVLTEVIKNPIILQNSLTPVVGQTTAKVITTIVEETAVVLDEANDVVDNFATGLEQKKAAKKQAQQNQLAQSSTNPQVSHQEPMASLTTQSSNSNNPLSDTLIIHLGNDEKLYDNKEKIVTNTSGEIIGTAQFARHEIEKVETEVQEFIQPVVTSNNQTTTEPNNQTTTEPNNQTTTEPNNQTTTEPNNQTTTEPNNQTTQQIVTENPTSATESDTTKTTVTESPTTPTEEKLTENPSWYKLMIGGTVVFVSLASLIILLHKLDKLPGNIADMINNLIMRHSTV